MILAGLVATWVVSTVLSTLLWFRMADEVNLEEAILFLIGGPTVLLPITAVWVSQAIKLDKVVVLRKRK